MSEVENYKAESLSERLRVDDFPTRADSDDKISDTRSELKLLDEDAAAFKQMTAHYDRYLEQMDDVIRLDTQNVKRTFDDYMEAVDSRRVGKVNHDICENLKDVFRQFDSQVLDVEEHFGGGKPPPPIVKRQRAADGQSTQEQSRKSGGSNPASTWESIFIHEELQYDFFAFYKILVHLWFGELHKKSEVREMQPCKIMLLRSLMKRKFDEELDLRLAKQESQNHQAPPEPVALQAQRAARRREQQVRVQALLQTLEDQVLL